MSLAVILSANVSFLLSTRTQSHDAAVRSLENLALGIERSVAAEITERADDLTGLVQLLGRPASASTPALDGFEHALGPFSLFDAQGRAAASPSSRLPAGEYAEESFLTALKASVAPGALVAVGPFARMPNVALILSQRWQAGDGAFEGAVANTIGFDRIAEILGHYDLGDGGSVSILTEDGHLLASGRAGFRAGLDLSASPSFRHVAEHGVGSFDAESVIDRRSRAYVARRVAGAPLVLYVGTSLDTVYAPFRAVAEVEIAAALVLALLIAGFAAAVRRELRLKRASEGVAELAASSARRSEHLVTTYFENLVHGVLGIRVLPGGRFQIERVNAQAQKMLGIPDNLLGRDAREVFSGGGLPDFVTQLQHCLQTKRLSQRTVPFKAGGRSLSLRLTITPVFDEADGRISLLLASLEDVTFHEIAQAKLLQTHRMSGIERITSGVANEFNNLLQSMIGHLEMLAEEVCGNDSAATHARSAMDAAARGTRLTQGLLSSSSQQLLQPEAASPERILSFVSRSFEPKRNARVQLVSEVEPGTPSVFADTSHLQSALLSICENGQEAMLPEGGTLSLRVYAKSGLSPAGTGVTDRFVVFSIIDSGGGMTPDVLARAREPFFTTKGERFRSGLGLSMVDGFARQSGGELILESSPSKGTAVELCLPAAEPEPADEGWAPLSRPVRVLVVDDAADQLGMLEELLREEGCLVTALGNSDAAAAALRSSERFDILITDYIMPGISGMDLIEDAFKQQPGIMALLITGTPNTPERPAAEGTLSLLRKPFRADQLLRRVRQMARAAEHTTLIG